MLNLSNGRLDCVLHLILLDVPNKVAGTFINNRRYVVIVILENPCSDVFVQMEKRKLRIKASVGHKISTFK